jgi:hypothetical protein
MINIILWQACAFRDSYEKFKKAGAEVVGISGDDPSSHKVCMHKLPPYKIILTLKESFLPVFYWYLARMCYNF